MLNRILSALLALALFLGGLLAAVEIVLAQLGRPSWLVPHHQWGSWLADQSFTSGAARTVLVVLVIVGLLLLVVALRRGKPSTLALPSGTSGVQVSASRRDLERTLSTAARRTEGVSNARASAGRRAVKVQATTSMRSAADLQQRVTAAVTRELEDLGLVSTLPARITVSQESRR